MIMNKIGTDGHLAARLDQAFAGVKDNFLESLNSLNDGVERIAYYTSCMTDNYQDVCNKLKEEDKRFVLGLFHLVKDTDVIFHMIYLYIKVLLNTRSNQHKKSILERVVPIATNYSAGQASDAALMYAVTKSICLYWRTDASVKSALDLGVDSSFGKSVAKRVTIVTIALSMAGTLKHSADSAENLKILCPQFYNALYDETLEMMYFLIEPIIKNNGYLNINTASDEQIAATLKRMLKS